jgi:4-hydroxybenzoate polyprenyltransferase
MKRYLDAFPPEAFWSLVFGICIYWGGPVLFGLGAWEASLLFGMSGLLTYARHLHLSFLALQRDVEYIRNAIEAAEDRSRVERE